MTEFKFIL